MGAIEVNGDGGDRLNHRNESQGHFREETMVQTPSFSRFDQEPGSSQHHLSLCQHETVIWFACGLLQRQADGESSAAFTSVVRGDIASVDSDYRFHEGQAKSVSARLAAFDSLFEEVPAHLIIEARTVVLDCEYPHVIR
jgi:hypothetical protein